MACRAAGIDPVDGPFADFKNPEAYREECRRSMILGCVGKWAIHPSQIEHALEIYSPKPEDVARARKLEKAYAEAEARAWAPSTSTASWSTSPRSASCATRS
jgi:citrate lyase subunit beta/citryl-CoA lyase